MPIPVAIPGGPLPINDVINARAEAALTAFVQLLAAGTVGSSTVTPALTVDVPNTGATTPVLLDNAAKQLFMRATMIALATASAPAVGSAQVTIGQTSVTVSDARIVAANAKIFITPTSANAFWFGATGWWVTVVDGSFTLHSVNAAAGSAAQFNWLLS